MRSSATLLLAVTLLAGCAAPPANTSGAANRPGALQVTVAQVNLGARTTPLTHEGGIVFAKPITDGISDEKIREEAAEVALALQAALSAAGTMQAAEQLDATAAPPASRVLLAAPSTRPSGGPPSVPPGQATKSPSPSPTVVASPPDSSVAASSPDSSVAASPMASHQPGGGPPSVPPGQANKSPSPSPTVAASPPDSSVAASSPDSSVTASAPDSASASSLPASAAGDQAARAGAERKLVHAGARQSRPLPNGGQQVQDTYTAADAEGPTSVQAARTFDAAGKLVSTTETLAGTGQGVQIQASCTRTLGPDGGSSLERHVALTIDGRAGSFAWTTHVAADGAVSLSGTLTRTNGSTLTLVGSGPDDSHPTFTAHDAGLDIVAVVDQPDGTATVSFDAGPAGKATVLLDVGADAQP